MTDRDIVSIMAAIIHAGSEYPAYRESVGVSVESSAATAWQLYELVGKGREKCEEMDRNRWAIQ